jgi:hypothetical protein
MQSVSLLKDEFAKLSENDYEITSTLDDSVKLDDDMDLIHVTRESLV